jgi:hypothetical protein
VSLGPAAGASDFQIPLEPPRGQAETHCKANDEEYANGGEDAGEDVRMLAQQGKRSEKNRDCDDHERDHGKDDEPLVMEEEFALAMGLGQEGRISYGVGGRAMTRPAMLESYCEDDDQENQRDNPFHREARGVVLQGALEKGESRQQNQYENWILEPAVGLFVGVRIHCKADRV